MAASFLTARNLSAHGFRHAFFTREGGHSPAPFDSMHFGATGHSAEQLAANVQAAASALGVVPAHLYTATQVHGCDVRAVAVSDERAGVRDSRADALLAKDAGVACAIKVADCLPLLLADAISGAVVAVHSGWQGAVGNVAGRAVAALRHAVGHRCQVIAAIGPHIRACCFEVGDDVAARLTLAAGTDQVVRRLDGARPHVDLARVVAEQLGRAGVDAQAVEVVEGCSKCDGARFFSHRRDGEQSGRNLAAIVARPERRGHPG